MRTLTEPWTHALQPGTTYAAAAEFAVGTLTPGPCLVIGSPLAEGEALRDAGHAVTYLDWREAPEIQGVHVDQGDACALPYADTTFTAFSSTCCYCHLGQGRYGDPEGEDRPARFLAECRRVAVYGARFMLMTGPVQQGAPEWRPAHRIDTVLAVQRLAWIQGWGVVRTRAWHEPSMRWQPVEYIPRRTPEPPEDYLAVLLEAV